MGRASAPVSKRRRKSPPAARTPPPDGAAPAPARPRDADSRRRPAAEGRVDPGTPLLRTRPTLADVTDYGLGLSEDLLGGPSARRRPTLPRIPSSAWLTIAGLTTALAAASFATYELNASWLQSAALARRAERMDYALGRGPSPAIRFPGDGPYDRRLGYAQLPRSIEALGDRGFQVVAQARISDELAAAVEAGVFPIYDEKSLAGLTILGRDDEPVFAARYPEGAFATFDDVPSVLVQSLLHIENRGLLDDRYPYLNPAVEWHRLARAAGQLWLRTLGRDGSVAGASTMATQMEKFRHSPSGVTTSPREKVRQMASASLRAYRFGRETTDARRHIVLDYVNSVPLAAIPDYGEVNGLGAGLRLWYGVDVADFGDLLDPQGRPRPGREAEAGRAYRAALGLLVAHRRPSWYLGREAGRGALADLTVRHIDLLERDGVITRELAEAARAADPTVLTRSTGSGTPPTAPAGRKTALGIRAELLGLLGVQRVYELDRYDLTVSTTLDPAVQAAVATELGRLGDPAYVRRVGLTGPRLLGDGNPQEVVYSVLLYESTPSGNVLRVQADNFGGAFDPNVHAKLELGSTAKLRTLVTYLEVVEAAHRRLRSTPVERRRAYVARHGDPITVWVAEILRGDPDIELEALLGQAMARRYSASPRERFYTGGGVHTFSNFDGTYDAAAPTVSEAFRGSVNLVFIRMMRDIVDYHVALSPGSVALGEPGPERDAMRRAYLERSGERESLVHLRRFYNTHLGRSEAEIVERLWEGRPGAAPTRLAEVVRLPGAHPLELWTARYLVERPGAPFAELVAASTEERLESARWLFATSRREAQDRRIRTLLEADAFVEIHRRWRRLGYPFESLVPSYATAIGSSADRPAALSELVGIVVNDGLRKPLTNIETLHFAAGTPYETLLRRRTDRGERVMSPEVAAAVRAAMVDVVENGTARRVRGAFSAPDGSPLTIGGKTGTGDNRDSAFGPGGRVVDSRALNRTSTLAFFLGDRFFGVVTAYVEGEHANRHGFTSSLVAQVLRQLAPALQPVLREDGLGAGPVAADRVTPW